MTKAEKTKYFDSVAVEREKWRKRAAYYHRELEKYLRFLIPRGSSVLEIGCGTGELLASLNPGRGIGIDISPKTIDMARSKFPDLQFYVGDAENMQLNEKFDYIIMVETIGHVDDIQLAFKELHKVCRPETRLIIVHYNYLWEPALKAAEYLRLRMRHLLQHWLPLEDISNLLDLNDFQVIQKGYRFLLPIYIPLISTVFNKLLANMPFFRKLSLVEVLIARPYFFIEKLQHLVVEFDAVILVIKPMSFPVFE